MTPSVLSSYSMATTPSILVRGGVDPAVVMTRGLGPVTATPPPPNAAESPGSGPPVIDFSSPPLDPRQQAALVQSLLQQVQAPLNRGEQDEGLHAFSGSDMRVVLDVCGLNRKPKQLIELVTLTVSIHREKAPVRALGYINAKAFARGRRTIAGTLVLTQFNVDFLYRFLGAEYSKDFSKDTTYYKIDQLPPFNLTLLFTDEYGNSSYRKLLGCDLVTDGTVYSSSDLFTEQSLTYMASDFTPLLPISVEGTLVTAADPRTTGAEKSVKDAMLRNQAAGVPA